MHTWATTYIPSPENNCYSSILRPQWKEFNCAIKLAQNTNYAFSIIALHTDIGGEYSIYGMRIAYTERCECKCVRGNYECVRG